MGTLATVRCRETIAPLSLKDMKSGQRLSLGAPTCQTTSVLIYVTHYLVTVALCFLQISGSPSAEADARSLVLNTHSSDSKHRRILRGSASYASGVQSLKGDQASFKAHGNHGPITWFDQPFQDGTFRISWQHELEQTVTLVVDHSVGEKREHVLKVLCQPKEIVVISYGPGAGRQQHSQRFTAGTWHTADLKFKGEKLELVLDGVTRSFTHPGFSVSKSSCGILHGWGTLMTREASLVTGGSGGGRLKTHQQISAPKDSILANLHLTQVHSFGIEAKNFNGVTDKTINNILA
jgi:hypothetical protein